MTPVKCPICRKPVAPENPDSPFCSDRCRILDLGNWASERYVFSSPINDSMDDPDDPAEPDS
jgi:endogenous inhibitor of DNA gyrase (YacG/DUF329 family)